MALFKTMKTLHTISCLLATLWLLGGLSTAASAADYPVLPPGSYPNDPDVAGECLPKYQWPVFGQACRRLKDDGSSSGLNASGSSSSSSSGTGIPNCPAPNQPPPEEVNIIPCDSSQDCSQDCVEGPPVCAAYGSDPNTGECVCTEWQTPEDCKCAPKCNIPDPVNYPYCCSVVPKGDDYPCLMVCTLPNGDKVDIEENPPRCKRFKECCYGKRDPDGTIVSQNPVETEPGDPRDYCKLKCVDVCEDKQMVVRSRTASDIFPECCTPPIPLEIACACCREPQNQPSNAYCEYFHRFFNCDAAKMACPANAEPEQCRMSVPPEPAQYDANYDAFLKYDPRFSFCSGEWTNRNCRYICRGSGILTAEDAPTQGIWVKDYRDIYGNPIENNYALQVHGNCAQDETQVQPVPWPPPNQALETCD